jgi:hypothetical protein
VNLILQLVAAVLIGVGGIIVVLNWWTILQNSRGKQYRSPIVLLGTAFLGAGMFILPATRWYFWSALILDFGTLMVLLGLITEMWRGRRILVHEYFGETATKRVCLRLYRRGIFSIEWQRREPWKAGPIVGSDTDGWQREGPRLTLSRAKESAIFDLVPDATRETFRQSVGFPSLESRDDTSLANIDFVRRGW